MASVKQQPSIDLTAVWHPIKAVPIEQVQAWVRWHDESQGLTSLAADRDALWWSSQGATHWRMVTETEAAAYNRPGRSAHHQGS